MKLPSNIISFQKIMKRKKNELSLLVNIVIILLAGLVLLVNYKPKEEIEKTTGSIPVIGDVVPSTPITEDERTDEESVLEPEEEIQEEVKVDESLKSTYEESLQTAGGESINVSSQEDETISEVKASEKADVVETPAANETPAASELITSVDEVIDNEVIEVESAETAEEASTLALDY